MEKKPMEIVQYFRRKEKKWSILLSAQLEG